METTYPEKLSWVELMFNPFKKWAGSIALGAGLLTICLAAFIGSLNNLHFDGVLDAHVGMPGTLGLFVVESLMDWLILGIVFLICGLVLSQSRPRAIDILGTQALARWPMVFVALLSFMPGLEVADVTNISKELIVFGLLALLFTIWMVALMFNAYKVSTNLKGAKLIVSFIAGLMAAEVISKLLLVQWVFPLFQ